jgi:hypothetical protein
MAIVQDGAGRAYIDRNAKREIFRAHLQGSKSAGLFGETHGGDYSRRAAGTLLVHFAMPCDELGHAKSLREICGGLAASEGKLRHLGLPTAPARSTLAYANEHRPWQLQQTIFEQLLAKCQILAASQPGTRKKRKFRFKNPLLSLDATVIDLCATMFDWAKFRLTKGAVKVHLLLDHDGYLPSFAVITEGKKHEVCELSCLTDRSFRLTIKSLSILLLALSRTTSAPHTF